MVAFTCNSCGASVKKAAVEKHYYNECSRGRTIDLTCIDCLQDFNAGTYGSHVKCLTENEKYGAKGTVERSNNKGEVKQQDWLAMIADVYETHSLDPKHKQILEHIMNYDNIPRKKKPFLNFMRSSARMFKNEAVIESLYDILDKEQKSRLATNNSAKTQVAQNGTKEESTEGNNCDETPLDNSEVVSEKKKKRRNKHKSESRQESAPSEEAETSQTELESENNPPTPDESTESGKKLSRKEKKEKKRREKYLTELNEIENYEKVEEVNGGAVEEETSGKKKKDKKNRHKSESEMETVASKTATEKNGTDDVSSAAPLERKLSKKEKKRKISENAAAEGESKKKHKNLKAGDDVSVNEKKKEKVQEVADEETQEFIKPDKFKIDKIVRIILQSQGGEIALKRLAKRVCTEYQFRCGIQDSDYIMAKFQKKIYNIPGVKIMKDKAVLLQ